MSRALGSKYVLGESIGKGAMGEAFRGTDHQGNVLAFKLLHAEMADDTEVVQRFVLERSILVALNGENLVEVHDLVMEGETLAIVMDLISGGDLRTAIINHGPFAPSEVCRIGAGIARGLSVVHAAGIIHRDIKPANILLAEPAETPVPKLTDFGISSLIDVDHFHRTTVVGTPQYIAPEIAAGHPGLPASDLYSLGIVLYEMAVGVTPFAGGSVLAVLQRHSTTEAARPEGIPDELWNMISVLLAKSPAQRPADAAEVATSLDRLVALLAAFPPAAWLDAPPEPLPLSDATTLVTLPAEVEAPATALPATEVMPADAGHPKKLPWMAGQGVADLPNTVAERPGNQPSVPSDVPDAASGYLGGGPSSPQGDAPAGRSRGSRGVLFVVVGVVLALALAGAAVFFYFNGTKDNPTGPNPQAETTAPSSGPIQQAKGTAPDLRGMTMTEARAALPTNVKLVVTRAPEADVPLGQISVQDPAVGEKRGDTLTVGIVYAEESSAPEATETPETPTSPTADPESGFQGAESTPVPSQGSWTDMGGAKLRGAVHDHALGARICGAAGPESGKVVYDLAGKFESFTTTVGLSEAAEAHGTTAQIEAIIDGVVYDSATISKDSFREWDIDLAGASTLEFNWDSDNCGSASEMLWLGSPVFSSR
ncbi:serine/threonine-protein kinase [Paeniglutamicibacter antarcticus]|uniref:non-specific serine/threonine protein kinase n=1 Tax=Paeniglutamicibacter antarcticus TaxID=494023 RepID=A0ABP9TLX1_9MICC